MNNIIPFPKSEDTTIFYCHSCEEEYTLPESTECCVICGGDQLEII